MSFREKSAWIALIAYLLVFGGYFFVLWQGWDEGRGRGMTIGLLIGATVALILLTSALAITAAILNPREANAPADERETLIDLKSERMASYALSAGVVGIIGALIFGMDSTLAANLLLANLVVAALVKAANQIVFFRTGV